MNMHAIMCMDVGNAYLFSSALLSACMHRNALLLLLQRPPAASLQRYQPLDTAVEGPLQADTVVRRFYLARYPVRVWTSAPKIKERPFFLLSK